MPIVTPLNADTGLYVVLRPGEVVLARNRFVAQAGSTDGWSHGWRSPTAPNLVLGLPWLAELVATIDTSRQHLALDEAILAGSTRLRLTAAVYWWVRRGDPQGDASAGMADWPLGEPVATPDAVRLATLVRLVTEFSDDHAALVARLARAALAATAPPLDAPGAPPLSHQLRAWSAQASANLLRDLDPIGLQGCLVLTGVSGGAVVEGAERGAYNARAGVDPDLRGILELLRTILAGWR